MSPLSGLCNRVRPRIDGLSPVATSCRPFGTNRPPRRRCSEWTGPNKKRRLKRDVSDGVFSIAEDTGIRLFLFSYHDSYATSRYVEATYSPKIQADVFCLSEHLSALSEHGFCHPNPEILTNDVSPASQMSLGDISSSGRHLNTKLC